MRKIYIILAIAMLPLAVLGQSEMGLHFMREIQQSTQTNPAIFPDKKVNVNVMLPLPALSLGFANSGFTWNKVLQPTDAADTALFLDFENAKMGKTNRVSSHLSLDLINVTFRVKKMNFMLGASERFQLNMKYPNEFLDFFFNGNVDYVGETFNPEHSFRWMHYREYSLGGAYNLNDEYTFGARFKLLAGLGTVLSERSNISLATGEASEGYAWTVETDYLINMAGYGNNTPAGFDEGEYMTNHGNLGWGLDLGGTWKYDDKWSFAASIIDIGSITWDTYNHNYMSKGDFFFEGVNLNDFVAKGLTGTNAQDTLQLTLDDYMDSIATDLGFNEEANSFKTPLITKTYLSGSYRLDSTQTVSLLLFGEFYKGLNAGVTVAYNKRFGKVFQFGGYYSYKNRDFLNLGLSTVLDVPRFQLYVLTDNVIGLVFPRHVKNFHLRFGANWTFGREGPKKVKEPKAPKVKKEKKKDID